MLTADQAGDNFVDTLLNNNSMHLSILRIGIEFSEISLPVDTAFQLISLIFWMYKYEVEVILFVPAC